MTILRRSIYAAVAMTCALSAAENSPPRDKLIAVVERLSKQQQQLADELDTLLRLLGMQSALEDVTLIPADSDASEVVTTNTRDGIKAYGKKRYEAAKEDLQAAWEDAPNSAFTNFNLGMVYNKLGKIALSKKMFKATLDIDDTIAAADKVRTYLDGKKKSAKDDEESDALKTARTELINHKKEVDSYISSKTLPLAKRMTAAAKSLEAMITTAEPHDKLVQEYYVDIGKTYVAFEMYDKALVLFLRYERAMDGKVLPDGYHDTLLQVQEKKKELDIVLDDYLGNDPDDDISRKLGRDLRELEIFATQMEEFVKTPSSGDPDFAKVCRRLKEYRWGDRPNRHVIVANRYQELLYSSLEGTLSLERYQDEYGNKFFKNITLLADRVPPKKPQFVTVDLKVNGTTVPYVIMYSYIPEHQAFVIVRLPRRDLA